MTAKTSDGQSDLFTAPPPFVPAWKSNDFDPVLADRYKREAMARAASSTAHQQLLTLVRSALEQLALSRENRSVTSDDASAWLIAKGYSPSDLGNAAGSIFRGGAWQLIGFTTSARVSRHRNRIGIWKWLEHRE